MLKIVDTKKPNINTLKTFYFAVKACVFLAKENIFKAEERIAMMLDRKSRCPACNHKVYFIKWDGETFHHECPKCKYDASLYKIYPFNLAHEYYLLTLCGRK